MVLFCRANKHFVQGENDLLNDLAANTGLGINRSSKIVFSKGCKEKKELSDILEISVGSLPVRYLRLPLTIQYPKAKHFLPLADKLRAKIDGWMVAQLNFCW